PFFEPVDLTAVEGYLKVVKHPMELKTVYVKLILNNYPNFQKFLDDVLLIFQNCRTFNKPSADIVYQCLQ
ncbi:Bromodomain-containing protein, partial [Powellomyces hirtus]